MADLAIAVVGVGVHGSRYAEHLLRGDVPGARLAGVSRRNPADATRWTTRGVRFETDAHALLADPAVDAVVVASPPTVHEEHALAVLSLGKPLLLEKPVAPDAAACARIRAAAERLCIPVLVGHSHRFNPAAAASWGFLKGARGLTSLSLSQRHPRAPLPWQFELPGGGALLCLGVHLADLARWLTGEELEVVSCRVEGEPGEAEGAADIEARTISGILVHMDASIVAPARHGMIEARGIAEPDAGGVPEATYEVQADLLRGDAIVHSGGFRSPLAEGATAPGLVPLMVAFTDRVRGEYRWTPKAPTLADGIAAVEFVEKCRAAAGNALG